MKIVEQSDERLILRSLPLLHWSILSVAWLGGTTLALILAQGDPGSILAPIPAGVLIALNIAGLLAFGRTRMTVVDRADRSLTLHHRGIFLRSSSQFDLESVRSFDIDTLLVPQLKDVRNYRITVDIADRDEPLLVGDVTALDDAKATRIRKIADSYLKDTQTASGRPGSLNASSLD